MTRELHSPSSSFALEISLFPNGEDIKKCIQCGICSATCPVAFASNIFRPRKLIQWILIGKREEVLKSDIPWFCMTCRTCEERCQEGVSPAEIFQAVRHLAISEGYAPEAFKKMVDIILTDGWMLKDAFSDFIEDDREALGLDRDLHWNNEFVKMVKKKYFDGEE